MNQNNKLEDEENKSIFKQLSHEECLKLLRSFTDESESLQLRLKAQEIINKRN